MSERWVDYFEASLRGKKLLDYAVDHWTYNMQLYYQIRKHVLPHGRILEIGCGLGLSSIYLQECGYEVTAVDKSESVIQMARRSAEMLSSHLTIEPADALDMRKYYNGYDACFSVGVIEHFERDVTVKLLEEQKNCARCVIAVVPSKYTAYVAEITDERIYTARGLKRIFRDAGLRNVSLFGYGDIPSTFHSCMKYFVPFGAYRVLQNYFSYTMSIGCVGMAKG